MKEVSKFLAKLDTYPPDMLKAARRLANEVGRGEVTAARQGDPVALEVLSQTMRNKDLVPQGYLVYTATPLAIEIIMVMRQV